MPLHHPCIFSWGVCNEIGGQNPPAFNFAKKMYEAAKRLDPKRLVSHASNSLQKTPGKDVSAIMDYIMWNEYYESWYGGFTADLARNPDEIHEVFPGQGDRYLPSMATAPAQPTGQKGTPSVQSCC